MTANIQKYLSELKQAYINADALVYWQDFENRIHGASDEDIAQLTAKYPLIPQSLVDLLKFVDGTYWREYNGKPLTFYMFGSIADDFAYPCFLQSCEQMLNSNEVENISGHFERNPNWCYPEQVDEKIIDDYSKVHWLHFSDCANNGGDSQLFIDFSPSEKGKMGQIVMLTEELLWVIADSFDDFLQLLIDKNLTFVDKEQMFWEIEHHD